jgi:hypothetical protein
MTSKLRALFKIMREVEKRPGENPASIVSDLTGRPERDAKILVALINPNPDERSKPWKNE